MDGYTGNVSVKAVGRELLLFNGPHVASVPSIAATGEEPTAQKLWPWGPATYFNTCSR